MTSLDIFRQLGTISRQAMLAMNKRASQFGLDNNLFLYLTRIVENEGLSQSALANMLQIDKTTISRALRKLEDKGLIKKELASNNKKLKHLYPTEAALDIYNQLLTFEEDYTQRALLDLTPLEKMQLTQLLARFKSF
ncbi:MarR family winged helix-turn-helix transcriptional regulator [Streptococcus massiliensis]|uniref:Multiple antibiotic resistance operon transcription repressor MarR n=1 Tax=Streptococcus massiliensis TaxID=313439 RepID=A0A380L0T8_9STRE|nr:MarR family transcriptional regulator [Streptococcus massiliensis]SUN77496.1 multiple antibiotic resistance operon transcription repressor MarR [Streptococcus massiliensis]